MMRILLLLFSLTFLISCNNNSLKENIDIEQAKKELDIFLTNWHMEAANADFEVYFEKMAEDGIYIGTDENERWTKEEYMGYAKPYFDKKNTWNFKAKKRTITFSEDMKYAWFDELLDTWMGVSIGSGVLKKNENDWEIVHYVLSLKVPNMKMKEVIQVISNEKN